MKKRSLRKKPPSTPECRVKGSIQPGWEIGPPVQVTDVTYSVKNGTRMVHADDYH